ncbi:MAG: tRNA epoxyqueuosine(34) reductase QueG [Clostridia bacterium]|nr:tRNA epoxyqueuosine(34) reductase QueG [Deltaproteobacteria bacterium]
MDLGPQIRDAALALGFARVGFTPVEPFVRGAVALADWLEKGRHGDMTYMAEHNRADPKSMLEQARTLIVVAFPYTRTVPEPPPMHGRVARYAMGRDYHTIIHSKLLALAAKVSEIAERPILSRLCVDSAPILEREAAERAGVGFIAKNTMSIAPGLGSYFFLGELLVDLDIAYSSPERTRCGSCNKCIDACPTGAIVDAHVLDARRCISYLTIEMQGVIPRELRPLIGSWIYGCDICQEVCPFNASKTERAIPQEMAPRFTSVELGRLMNIGSSQFKQLTKGSAMRRVNRYTLQRNAAVALGNSKDPRAVPLLIEALRNHKSALVRAHAAWGLTQFDTAEAKDALAGARQDETADEVLAELMLSR